MERTLLTFNYTPQNSETEKHYDILVHKIDLKYIRGIVVSRLNNEEKNIFLNYGYRQEYGAIAFEDSNLENDRYDKPSIYIKNVHTNNFDDITVKAYRMFIVSNMKNVEEIKVCV